MRRLVPILVSLLALAAPAAASAVRGSVGDGWLVVQGGDNGDGIGTNAHPYDARPVVTLVITGFVIGHVSDQGRILIYDLSAADKDTPEVTGATRVRDLSLPKGGDGTMWTGTDFRFRAVQGTYKVVIWGSGVYVFAGGQGTVTVTGSNDTPRQDGKYSLNGGSFVSIPVFGQKTIGLPDAG
jgi:hypothetical protein